MANHYTDKEVITKEEYYQLIGLLTLGREYDKRIDDIIKATIAITGEGDTCGHSADAVYCGYQIDELLEKLDIKVQK